MRPYVNKKKLGKTIRKIVFCTSQAELMMLVNSGFKDAQLSCVFEKKKFVFARNYPFIFMSIHFFIIAYGRTLWESIVRAIILGKASLKERKEKETQSK